MTRPFSAPTLHSRITRCFDNVCRHASSVDIAIVPPLIRSSSGSGGSVLIATGRFNWRSCHIEELDLCDFDDSTAQQARVQLVTALVKAAVVPVMVHNTPFTMGAQISGMWQGARATDLAKMLFLLNDYYYVPHAAPADTTLH